jgi:hypothetical protein
MSEEIKPAEETQEKQKIHDIEIIPKEAMIKLEISGFFYARLNNFITNYYKIPGDVDPKTFTSRAMDPNCKDKTEDEFNFETIMGLVVGLEQEARDQKLTKIVKYDTEKGAVIEEENPPAPQDQEQTELPDSTPPSSTEQTT